MLNLRNYFDIYEILTYPDKFEIKSQLQKLVQSVEVPSIEIHVDDAIVRLAQSGLKDFDIDKFTDNVSQMNCSTVFSCINCHFNLSNSSMKRLPSEISIQLPKSSWKRLQKYRQIRNIVTFVQF